MNTSIIGLVFYLLLCFIVVMFFNRYNNLNILIHSEFVWILLFSLYILLGGLSGIATATAVSLYIMVFAAIDCSIWLLCLIYFTHANGSVFEDSGLTYLFRCNRLLKNNRFFGV